MMHLHRLTSLKNLSYGLSYLPCQHLFMFRFLNKLSRHSAISLTSSGALILGTLYYFNPPVSLLLQSVKRFCTSAYYVGLISADYKWSFRNVEKSDPTYRDLRKQVDLRCGQRLLKLCKKNKGLYVKFAQHVASLNHVLPLEITETLSVLQDHAVYQPYASVAKLFQEEFKKSPKEIFTHFEEIPIASASLAQVHRASIGDAKYAVKVQYLNIDRIFEDDIRTVRFLLKAVQRAFPDTPFGWLVPELKHVENELDFVNEGKNSERAKHMFKGNDNVKIPDVNWNLSTKRILTMEYIDGIKINDLISLKRESIDKHKVAEILVDMFSTQVFEHGFVHSDLHPGNLFIRKLKNGKLQLVLLDHGLYREIPENVRLNYCHLWKALVLRDFEEIKYYSKELGAGDYYEIFAAMLTHRTPTNRDIGLGQNISPEEVEKLKALFRDGGMKKVNIILESLPGELLFIFKTTNLVRSINKDLGATVNRFQTMARHGLKGIYQGKKQTVFRRLIGMYESFKFELLLSLYTILFTFASWKQRYLWS